MIEKSMKGKLAGCTISENQRNLRDAFLPLIAQMKAEK